jgi:hypothetical protein
MAKVEVSDYGILPVQKWIQNTSCLKGRRRDGTLHMAIK